MSQSERLQIITGTDAPQSLDHLSGVGKLIALVPFPSPNYNHSKSAYSFLGRPEFGEATETNPSCVLCTGSLLGDR